MRTVINHCEKTVSTKVSANLANKFVERLLGKGACHDYQRCVPGIPFERHQRNNFRVAKSRQDDPYAQKVVAKRAVGGLTLRLERFATC